jgi:hypothetical protein
VCQGLFRGRGADAEGAGQAAAHALAGPAGAAEDAAQVREGYLVDAPLAGADGVQGRGRARLHLLPPALRLAQEGE